MKKVIFLIALLTFINFYSQENFDAGFLPKVILSKKLSYKTKWINSIESRSILYDDIYKLKHSLIDYSSIISLKTELNQTFNFGYIVRFIDNSIIHRTFQHYNFVSKFQNLKIGNRIAFEQFYQKETKFSFRTRYRFSFEKSLNGERVDVKEFYLKFSNEYLYDFYDLEIRFSPYLGFKASKKDRIEIGLDYRIGEIIVSGSDHNLWFRTTWYISI